MKALFLVDLQNDFIEQIPYVDRMILIGVAISKIHDYKRKGLPIITTMDSHFENHYEFLKHGKHCIVKSEGEQLYTDIAKALEGYPKHYIVKKKIVILVFIKLICI